MIYRRTLQTCKDGPREEIGARRLFHNLFPDSHCRLFFAIEDQCITERRIAQKCLSCGAMLRSPRCPLGRGRRGRGCKAAPEDRSR